MKNLNEVYCFGPHKTPHKLITKNVSFDFSLMNCVVCLCFVFVFNIRTHNPHLPHVGLTHLSAHVQKIFRVIQQNKHAK